MFQSAGRRMLFENETIAASIKPCSQVHVVAVILPKVFPCLNYRNLVLNA